MEARPSFAVPHAAALTLPTSSTTLRAVAVAGAAVGVLDAADGVVFAGITAGQNPIQVLQWIASGALAAAGLGAAIHFALAYAFTGAFIAAWTRFEVIRRNWIVAGLAWGAAVWAIMNLLVLPLSPVAPPPFTLAGLLNGVLGHAITVGLAAAYVARRVLAAK